MDGSTIEGTVYMPAGHLLDLLRRAAAGEDPALLIAEEYANAHHESVRQHLERLYPPDDSSER